MKFEYSIVYREPDSAKLGFLKFVTPVNDLFDFCDLLQQQIKKGVIPPDATVVNVSISDIVSTVDWSQAPEGTQAYACNEDGTCYWYIGGGAQLFKDFGKFLCESWVSRELAPNFKLNCKWHESLVFKPTAQGGKL
jgi:hypothetical protein